MKKVFVIAMCLYFPSSFSESILAQKNGTRIDSTSVKRENPSINIRKQETQLKKSGSQDTIMRKPKVSENDTTMLRKADYPLLIREKDSLQKKTN